MVTTPVFLPGEPSMSCLIIMFLKGTENVMKRICESVFDAITASSKSFLFLENKKTGTCYWSENSLSLFGFKKREVSSEKLWNALLAPENLKLFLNARSAVISGEKDRYRGSFLFQTANGLSKRLECSMWVAEYGEESRFIGVLREIVPSQALDPVTGLRDNRGFREFVYYETERRDSGIILILGLDDYANVNDLHSYAFGDKLLRMIAYRIQKFLPERVSLFKLDGDRFGAVFPPQTDKWMKNWFAGLQKNLAEHPFEVDQVHLVISCSGGYCRYPEDGKRADDLYRNGILALRVAKKHGKNQIAKYQELMSEVDKRYARLQIALRESVSSHYKGFYLYYQPIVSVKDDRTLYGCEALLRWQSNHFPEGVSPTDFIPIMEESGLILEMTYWVVETALKQCAEWIKIKPDFHMSINICSMQFERLDFSDWVIDQVIGYGVKPENVTLELTESGKVEDTIHLQKVFDYLRGQGLRIALDDFGTGYSTLDIFRNLKADVLKIDRSFLERIEDDTIDQALVALLIEVSHKMQMKVCVEGIERESLVGLICDMDADLLQGYYYGEPMPPKEFQEKFLS